MLEISILISRVAFLLINDWQKKVVVLECELTFRLTINKIICESFKFLMGYKGPISNIRHLFSIAPNVNYFY